VRAGQPVDGDLAALDVTPTSGRLTQLDAISQPAFTPYGNNTHFAPMLAFAGVTFNVTKVPSLSLAVSPTPTTDKPDRSGVSVDITSHGNDLDITHHHATISCSCGLPAC
jgi:hypothetical protein